MADRTGMLTACRVVTQCSRRASSRAGRQAGSVVGEECRKAQDGYVADRTGMLTTFREVTQVLTQGV